MSDTGGPKPGLLTIGEEAKPPFAILPDLSRLFKARSERFAELAPGHQLAPYLEFLSKLTAAQHAVLAELSPPPALDPERVAQALAHGMPPLVIDTSKPDSLLDETLLKFLDALARNDLTEAPRAAVAALRALPADARLALMADALAGAPTDQLAQRTLVLAALQVHAARLAQQMSAEALKPIADGVCPCCGKPAAASAVVNWPSANNTRFCFCSLCGTTWNVVRVKCILCNSTKGITYRVIEGQSETVKAEACDSCKGYVKIVYQVQHPQAEPFADDVASLGLDLLLREDGWTRGGQNLFLLGY